MGRYRPPGHRRMPADDGGPSPDACRRIWAARWPARAGLRSRA